MIDSTIAYKGLQVVPVIHSENLTADDETNTSAQSSLGSGKDHMEVSNFSILDSTITCEGMLQELVTYCLTKAGGDHLQVVWGLF